MTRLTHMPGLGLVLEPSEPETNIADPWDWSLRVVAGDILSELNELGLGSLAESKFVHYLEIVAFNPECGLPVTSEELAETSEMIRGSTDDDYESPEDAVPGVRAKDWSHALTVARDAGLIEHDRAEILSRWSDAVMRHSLIGADMEVVV